jgi:hypothetical protein
MMIGEEFLRSPSGKPRRANDNITGWSARKLQISASRDVACGASTRRLRLLALTGEAACAERQLDLRLGFACRGRILVR